MVKGIVKRGVTELVTPSVTFNEQVWIPKKIIFAFSLHKKKEKFGIALVDVSTGEFLVAEGNLEITAHCSHFWSCWNYLPRTAEIPSQLKIRTVLS